MDLAKRALLYPQTVIIGAKLAQKQTGCLASVTLAQFGVESSHGHALPPGSNNPFGIKARAGQPFVVAHTKEEVNGKMITVEAKFAKYTTFGEAFIAHGELLMNPHGPYKSALPFKNDWKAFIQHIAPIYATDHAYATKLIDEVEAWQLTDYDQAT